MRSLLDGAFVTKQQGRRYDFEIDLRVTFVFFFFFFFSFSLLSFHKYVVQLEHSFESEWLRYYFRTIVLSFYSG
jgi:hypothetical protein